MTFHFPYNGTYLNQLSHGWVASCRSRGTTDIMLSCAATLFIALWTQLHLNIPGPTEGWWYTGLRKLKWLFVGFICPEVILLMAAGQRAAAAQSLEKIQHLGHGSAWSMRHSFFADSGGIVIETKDGTDIPVTSEQIYQLVRSEHIPMPQIAEEEIKDKSNGDAFSKLIASCQLSWSLLDCLARLALQLPISPIELQINGIAICAIATSLLWWEKPLDAFHPIRITMDKSLGDVDPALSLGVLKTGAYVFSTSPLLRSHATPSTLIDRLPNDRNPHLKSLRQCVVFGTVVMVFTGLSFADWNFAFPTSAERGAWRVGCIVATLSLGVHGVTEAVLHGGLMRRDVAVPYVGGYKLVYPVCLWFWIPFVVYVVVRMVFIVLEGVTVRHLPRGCYLVVPFLDYFPHF